MEVSLVHKARSQVKNSSNYTDKYLFKNVNKTLSYLKMVNKRTCNKVRENTKTDLKESEHNMLKMRENLQFQIVLAV